MTSSFFFGIVIPNDIYDNGTGNNLPINARKQKPTYLIKEACERIGRSRDAIIGYIRKGITPDVERNYRGDRVFTDEDIDRFREVARQQKLKKLGKLRQFAGEQEEAAK